MGKFTERDEIEVQLRYINRVRSLQPSEFARQDLDAQERRLRERLKHLDERTTAVGSVTLSSTTTLAHGRPAGFSA